MCGQRAAMRPMDGGLRAGLHLAEAGGAGLGQGAWPYQSHQQGPVSALETWGCTKAKTKAMTEPGSIPQWHNGAGADQAPAETMGLPGPRPRPEPRQ